MEVSRKVVISVVRDFDMYKRCVSGNPFLTDCEQVPIDNRRDNLGVATRYNEFIDGFDFSNPAWLIFCHEDFEIKERPARLDSLDKNSLWGPIGVVTTCSRPWLFGGNWSGRLLGSAEETEKSGSGFRMIGDSVPEGTEVETFDCMCLIVHSSLIERTGVRFDEHLTFDLYVEDFCMAAKVTAGVSSRILSLRCRHWSRGNAAERYMVLREYLGRKYPKMEFFSSAGYGIGGGRTLFRRWQKQLRRFCDRWCPWLGRCLLRIFS